MACWRAWSRGRVRLNTSGPVRPRHAGGRRGRGLGDAELRLAAARAESEVELAKLLHQLENAGWAAGAEGTEPRSRAARLSAAAAALRILAGMGLGMEVRGGRLVAVQRISVPGV